MQHEELIRRRLHSQRLSGSPAAGPGEAVRWMGAVQAQDYPASLWGVSLRCGFVQDRRVEEAMTAGQIIRSWFPRGTLHFVPAADARWMRALLAPRWLSRMAKMHARDFDITEHVLGICREAIVRALEGGRELQRSDIYRVLNAAGVQTQGTRGLQILWRLGQEGLICYGPRHAKPQTLVLFDEWLADSPSLEREEALCQLTLRYFQSHGPATEADFAWWAGLTLGDVREGLALAGEELTKAVYDGQWHWFAPEDLPEAQPSSGWLLPVYDEFSVAYKNRGVLRGPGRALTREENSALIAPLLLVNGQARGTWKRTLRQGRLNLSFSPDSPLEDWEKALLEENAEEYAAHLTRVSVSEE